MKIRSLFVVKLGIYVSLRGCKLRRAERTSCAGPMDPSRFSPPRPKRAGSPGTGRPAPLPRPSVKRHHPALSGPRRGRCSNLSCASSRINRQCRHQAYRATFVATLQEPDTLTSLDWITVAKPRSCLKTGFDFMIKYSSYRRTNRTKSNAPTDLLRSLETEYHELQDLRERVRKAEAAAAASVRPRGNGHPQDKD